MKQGNLKQYFFQNKVKIILLIIIIVALFFSFALFKKLNQSKLPPQEAMVVRTKIVNIINNNMDSYSYSGEVRGRYESQLAFQVGGKIIKRNVELGSLVKAGDALMEIDPKDIEQLVTGDQAKLYSADSRLELAETDLKRYKQLLDDKAISYAQYDQYVSAYKVALAAAKQATAQFEQSKNQLGYSLLRADASGIVSNITAEIGQVVSAGQPVLVLVHDGEREIEISVPENRISDVRLAKQIKIKFWALPDLVLDGKVREISPMAEQTTRTFKVRISLLNPPPAVKLGMTASVSLLDDSVVPVAVVPLAAIYQSGSNPCVWVVKEDGTLSLRQVETGKFGDDTIQIINGLKQGEIIVTAGVHKLMEGQKVKPGGDSL